MYVCVSECVWVPYEYICILKRMWFRNHLFLCNQSRARVVGANKQEAARGTRDSIAHVFAESQYQLEFIVSKYAEFKTGILPLIGMLDARPTLVQTEARKWVFFFCSKVISIIITKSTAVRTRSTEHGSALSVKWLLCNLHDNKAVHGGRDRNEGRWWGSHTYLSKQKAEQVRAKFCYNLSCTKKLQAPTRGNRCVCVCLCVFVCRK